MPSLFTDNFPVTKNNEELARLQKQYSNYDGWYIASGSIPDRKKFFDEMYKQFEPHKDSNFLIDVKSNFHQRTWEMYLACVLLGKGFEISSSDSGPDIKLVTSGKTIWIECVAPQKGSKDSENYVPDVQYGVLQDVPEKQMLFRLRNSLNEKLRVYQKYVSDGIVKKDDIFIIAVNRASLDHVDTGIPLILKVLFSIGYQTFRILKAGEKKGDSKFDKPFWSIRKEVPKKNGSPVPMDFFQDPKHAGISAVIYSKDAVLSCREKMGGECVLMHNPLASSPLSEKTFPFFEQYRATEDKIIKI
ncbi:MAG: hypothetical protein WC858_02565 [Parcubacteria group bacterium]|jgi:hypothetical protein